MEKNKKVDVIVVGAGFTGIFATHKFTTLGYSVQTLEAGDGIGGTWYWNRYPGARTDSESYVYQYFFSEELLNEWNWKEKFPAQEETEKYLNFVAEKFDLKKFIRFGSKVTKAEFMEEQKHWKIRTEDGFEVQSQFLVMGRGLLSKPQLPDINGIDKFTGKILHTSHWPKTGLKLSNKDVGIIGTGATGLQVIQSIASEVKHLTVFQRTPNYTIPMNNPRFTEQKMAELRGQYPEIKKTRQNTFAGFLYDFESSYHELSQQERLACMERYWKEGSLSFWIGQFPEIFFEEEANSEISQFVKDKIRSRVNDPTIAEKLIPKDYGFGTRRVPLETSYYEVYNRPNVSLIDVRTNEIKKIAGQEVILEDQKIKLDVLILATGFDAGTGALTAIDLHGRDGRLLRDEWKKNGVSTFLGMQVHGYPNMFLVNAPMSPGAAFCNVPTCVDQQVTWIENCIKHVISEGKNAIEPSKKSEQEWGKHHDEVAESTLVHKTDSWYTGTNVKGKARRVIPYCGGVGEYKNKCDEVTANNFVDCQIY